VDLVMMVTEKKRNDKQSGQIRSLKEETFQSVVIATYRSLAMATESIDFKDAIKLAIRRLGPDSPTSSVVILYETADSS
jgi:hypothetical protein